jgi:hypothetical protein
VTVFATNAFTTAAGNGSTTQFPFYFFAPDPSQIAVYLNGVQQFSGWSAACNPGSGGTVTFATAPANGVAVRLELDPSFQQNVDFANAGSYAPETQDDALDQAAARDIYLLNYIESRTLHASAPDTISPLPPAASRANKYIAFDSNGDVVLDSITVTVEAGSSVSSRTLLALTAGATGQSALLTESGREGIFVFSNANLSAQVTGDPNQGMYVPLSTDSTGSSGAWVRKFAGLPNVKWWGAAGDGVTDDTAAINAALSYVSGKGMRLRFPAGTYVYSGGGVLSDGVVVEGDGRDSTVIVSKLASPSSGFLFNASGYGSGLRGLRFISSVTQTGGSYVQLTGHESFIDDFYMTGDFNGILMQGNVSRIRHGRFQDAATGAIRIRAEGGDNSQLIEDVLMGAQTPANIAAAGIRVRNSSALIISNVSVIQQGVGLLVDPFSSTSNTADSGPVFTLYVHDCFFDNNTRAVYLAATGTGGIYRSRFTDCWFGSSSQDGVAIVGPADGIHFHSCHGVLNAGAGFTTGSGVALNDIRIQGGLWAQNSFGMYFNQAFSGLSVTDATIGSGGGLNGNTNYGIVIADAAFNNFVISNNILTGNGSGSISNLATGTGYRIRDNAGYITSSKGLATISSGTTSVVVSHGLAVTPQIQDITLTRTSSNASSVDLYVSNITSAQFTINTGPAPTTSISVAWRAQADAGDNP